MAYSARYPEQLILMVSADVKREIREAAVARQVSISQVARELIETGLRGDPDA